MQHFGKRVMGLPKSRNHFISLNVNCVISVTVIQNVFSITHVTVTLETQRSVKFQSAVGVSIAAMSSGSFTLFFCSKSSTPL